MEKSLTAEEVYAIARPSVVAKLEKPDSIPSGLVDLSKTDTKLLSDKAKIDANLYSIYVKDKQEINESISDIKSNKDLAKNYGESIETLLNIDSLDEVSKDDIRRRKDKIINSSDEDLIKLSRKLMGKKEDLEKYIINTNVRKNEMIANESVFNQIIDNMKRMTRDWAIDKKVITNKHFLQGYINTLKEAIKNSRLPGIADTYRQELDAIKFLFDDFDTRNIDTNFLGFDQILKELRNDIRLEDSRSDDLKESIKDLIVIVQSIDNITTKALPLKERLRESEKKLSKLEKDYRESSEKLKTRLETKDTVNTRINKSTNVLKEHYKLGPVNKVILFEDISKYDTIGELMEDNDMLLIIYRTKPTYGHWVGLFRNSYGINYFNSYGTYIDKARDNIDKEFREMSNQNFPHLLKLLYEGNEDVFWNDKQLQLRDDKVNTCGRWVGYCMQRCAGLDGDSLEDFIESFDKMKSKDNKYLLDETITVMTNPYLKGDNPEVKWL